MATRLAGGAHCITIAGNETKHFISDVRRPARIGAAVHLIASPDNVENPQLVTRLLRLAATEPCLDFVELAPLEDAGLRAELAELLAVAGLEVIFNAGPAIWAGELDFADPDAGRRRAALRRGLELVEQARAYGAPLMQISPGPDHADRERALELTAAAMRELAAAAAPMRVACELYDREAFARRLVGPTEVAARLADLVGHDGFGLLLDTSHLLLAGEQPADAVARLGDAVAHAHVANCVLEPSAARAGDEHPYFGFAGGAVTHAVAASFIAALERSGYFDDPARGRVGVEIKAGAGEPAEALFLNGVRFLRQTLGGAALAGAGA